MRKKIVKRTAEVGLVLTLAGVSGAILAGPALASETSSATNNCYTIWFTRDWNQECGSGGAKVSGYYKSIVDCTAPQGPDQSREIYRQKGNGQSYDGDDCIYGINTGYLYYRT